MTPTPEQVERETHAKRMAGYQRDIQEMAKGETRRREATDRWLIYNLDPVVREGNQAIGGVGGWLLEQALITAFHGGDNGNRHAEFRTCLDTSFNFMRRIVSALDLLRDRQPTITGGWADHPTVADWLKESGWHNRVAEASSLAIALGSCLVRVSADPKVHLSTVYPQCVDVLPLPGLSDPGCLVERGDRCYTVWDIRIPGNPIAFHTRSLSPGCWINYPGSVEWYMSGIDYPLWVDGVPQLPAFIYTDPRAMSSEPLPLSRGLHTITLAEDLDSTEMRHALRDAPVTQLATLTQGAIDSTSTSAPAPSQILSVVGWSAGDEAMLKPAAADDVTKLQAIQAGRIQTATYEYVGSAAIEVSRSPESGIALSLRQTEKDGEFNRQRDRWSPVDMAMLTMVATLLIGSEAVDAMGPPSITYQRTLTPEEMRAVEDDIKAMIALGLEEPAKLIAHRENLPIVEARAKLKEIQGHIAEAGWGPDQGGVVGYRGIVAAAPIAADVETPLLPHEKRGVATREMADIAAAALLQAKSDPSVTPGDIRWGSDIRGRKPISMGRIAELVAWFTTNPDAADTLPGQLRGGAPGMKWAISVISGMDADLDGDGQPDVEPVSPA